LPPIDMPDDWRPDFTTTNVPVSEGVADLPEPEPPPDEPWYTRPFEAGKDLLSNLVQQGKDAFQSLYQRPEDVQQLVDALRAHAESQTPKTGNPLIDAPFRAQQGLANFAYESLGDLSTPLGALLNSAPEGKALELTGPALAQLVGFIGKVPFAKRLVPDLSHVVMPAMTRGKYLLTPEAVEWLKQFHELGATGRPADWRGVHAPELFRTFENDPAMAEAWADIFGATSAGTNVPENLSNTVAIWDWINRHPGQLLPEVPKGGFPPGQSLPRDVYSAIGLPSTKYPNVNRVLTGEPMSGMKVTAMGELMKDRNRLPIDRCVLYSLLGEKGLKWGEEIGAIKPIVQAAEGFTGDSPGKNALYLRFEDALLSAMHEIDPRADPRTTFAQMWHGIRTHGGQRWEGGPIDILQRKGMLDYGAMLDPKRLKETLLEGGWETPAVMMLVTKLAQRRNELFGAPAVAQPPARPPSFSPR